MFLTVVGEQNELLASWLLSDAIKGVLGVPALTGELDMDELLSSPLSTCLTEINTIQL